MEKVFIVFFWLFCLIDVSKKILLSKSQKSHKDHKCVTGSQIVLSDATSKDMGQLFSPITN